MNTRSLAFILGCLMKTATADVSGRGADRSGRGDDGSGRSADDQHIWSMVLQYMPKCFLPMDMLFLQDTSLAEEEDRIPSMSRMMQDIVGIIDRLHPFSSFGVAEFRDKPIPPFGWQNDVCFNLIGQLSPDPEQFANSYDSLWAGGGYDHAENHFGALMTAFGWQGVNWREIGLGQGETGARVVVLLTDSLSHYAGSHDNQEYPKHMVKNDGVITQDNITYDCEMKQYPEPAQLAKIVKRGRHQYVISVVPEIADQHIKDFWSYTNEKILGQPQGMVQFYGTSDKSLEEAVLRGLQEVTTSSCIDWYGAGMQVTEYGGFRRHKKGRYNSQLKSDKVVSDLIAAVPKNTDTCSNPCSCECSCHVRCPGAKYQCCTGDDGIVVIKQSLGAVSESYSIAYGNASRAYLW